jgi:hypothetical protein
VAVQYLGKGNDSKSIRAFGASVFLWYMFAYMCKICFKHNVNMHLMINLCRSHRNFSKFASLQLPCGPRFVGPYDHFRGEIRREGGMGGGSVYYLGGG